MAIGLKWALSLSREPIFEPWPFPGIRLKPAKNCLPLFTLNNFSEILEETFFEQKFIEMVSWLLSAKETWKFNYYKNYSSTQFLSP